ncbi:MAG: hypothetical protein AB7O52_06255 [Planctomycetota bacterium]
MPPIEAAPASPVTPEERRCAQDLASYSPTKGVLIGADPSSRVKRARSRAAEFVTRELRG